MTGHYYILYTQPGEHSLRVMRDKEGRAVIAENEQTLPELVKIANTLLKEGLIGHYKLVREC